MPISSQLAGWNRITVTKIIYIGAPLLSLRIQAFIIIISYIVGDLLRFCTKTSLFLSKNAHSLIALNKLPD
ncbi:hypothetical protein NA56DRAFT_53425 [Hyaloscypha hepaticicola]|uniref:Uncharacterized protein n=1 Tax=Hyaloscypha hepaticicola TaxID=2082293 RepID=A0A2J6QC79_9HELO|nr:hypothetical protein NA56DRAFT_53425 [Hyaloscypha hepaticicola]